MKLEESKKIRRNSFIRRWAIKEAKTHDYATDDMLSNFKRVSTLVKTLDIDVGTPHGIGIVYILLKLDRLCNLLFRRKSKPKNESLQDTVDDILNYMELLEEVLIDMGILEFPKDEIDN